MSKNEKWLISIIAVTFYMICAIIILRFPDYLLGREGDKFYWLFQFNFFADRVKEFASPFVHTDLEYYPDGFNMGSGYENIFCFVFFFIYKFFFNDNVSYNLLVPTNLTIIFIATYLFARHFHIRAAAAIIAALAFTFCNYTLVQIEGGQIHFSSSGFIPFFFLFLFRFFDRPDWKNCFLLGLSLFFVSLASWSWLIFILVILFFHIAAKLLCREFAFAHAKGLAIAGVFFTAIIMPFIWPMLGSILSGEAIKMQYLTESNYVNLADLMSYVTPQDNALFSNEFFHNIRKSFNSPYVEENAAFLGYFCMACFLYYIFAIRHKGRRDILLLTAVPFVLSLGPTLTVAGENIFTMGGSSFSLPLPYRVLMEIPLLEFARAPNRYVLFVFLFTSLVIGLVLEHVLARYKPNRMVGTVLLLSIAAIVIYERILFPFPVTKAAYEHLQEYFAGDRYEAIMSIPRASTEIGYLGKFVGKKVVGGRVNSSARKNEIFKFLQETPFVSDVSRAVSSEDYCSNNSLLGADIFRQSLSIDFVAGLLKKNGIGHVVLQRELWDSGGAEECPELYRYLLELFGPLAPSYRGEDFIIYDLSRYTEDGKSRYEYFQYTDSISELFDFGWMKLRAIEGTRGLFNLYSDQSAKKLVFKARSFPAGNRVAIFYNTNLIFNGVIDGRVLRQYETNFFLPLRHGVLVFVAENCVATAGSNTCYSLGLTDLGLVPK